MRIGPLRRIAGTAGLMALVPVGVMLVAGSLSIADAALRGGAIFVAVTTVGRVANWWMATLARGFEDAADTDGEPDDAAPAQPGTPRHSGGGMPAERRRAVDAEAPLPSAVEAP